MSLLFEPDLVFLQRFLRAGGYYKGDIDGLIGPKSRAALAEFEANGKPVADGLGSFDPRTEAAISTLLVPAQRAARQFMRDIASAGLAAGLLVRIISGTRTYAQQNALFAKGRPSNGPRVTQARGGQSNHNFGIAWDVGIFTPTGSYIDDLAGTNRMAPKAIDAEYKKVGAHGKAMGLFWGGDWRKPDYPHFQLLDNARIASIRDQFTNGGAYL